MREYFIFFTLDGRVIVFPYVNSYSNFNTSFHKEQDNTPNANMADLSVGPGLAARKRG